jgi:mRNA interferase RelE/StbE
MRILQSRSFENKVKRFSEKQKHILDKQIRKVIDNPSISQEKKGDLRGVFVHTFKIETVQFLLSYRFVPDTLELIMIGPHENYYRDLSRYLKNSKS